MSRSMVGVEKSEIHGGRGRREGEREKKREESGAYKSTGLMGEV